MTAKERKQSDETREVSALRSASLFGTAAPNRVLLAPWGRVESTSGSFTVDEESIELAVAAFDEHATDLPIDYEHQTLGGAYASPNGQAPAAGWVKRLMGEPGIGLLAEIEWTGQAKGMLESKQYRFLSPVAVIRRSDRKLVAIHSAALTNKPAIVGMEPIVNRVDIADAQEGTVPLERLRVELKLDAEAAAEEVLVAASEKLVEFERAARTRRVQERVREAIEAGKLVESQREWAEHLVAREQELFEEWFLTAPVMVMRGEFAAPTSGAASDRREAVAARARVEFRGSRLLSGLTSEEAYVADALRRVAC